MGKSKTIPLPMYDELDENAYNTANRNIVNNLGEWLSDNYQSIGSLNQDQEQEYKDIANKASESSWSDFNRQLAKAQDTRNAISYNRFGSLTNTPALYEQETFGREANKAALELANNITDYYNTMVNEDINRQLKTWQNYSNMYNKAGEDITKLDKYNWNLRNQNLDRAYTNDLQSFANYKKNLSNWGEIANIGGSLLGNIPQITSGISNWFNKNSANGKLFDSNSIDTSTRFA